MFKMPPGNTFLRGFIELSSKSTPRPCRVKHR